ncbi:unnamed protein product [Didymodactylos carnosus]|uniref:Innexin n=1 Tax=Didymodactylos carnosus TaxID=1234261 RepID=A0A813T4S8_9BILA|nr:unnamed protein product [Didymodactylos carnosus]CAF1078554.1 unnamed protein product [Didymodactylos carnosus]CAF3590676.1 unnamed protein product [Didymodactylos carnosus]CAF3841973.1 unnamed protein product [Didymodactylos carnosus]
MDLFYLIPFVSTLFLSQTDTDDDLFDRLNYKYTVALLLLFAILTTASLFGSNRIHCWSRANYPASYIKYTNFICFITQTYQLSNDERIPEKIADRKRGLLNYYQWTPFILLLMALFCYLPRMVWRALSVRSGIDLLDIIEAAGESKTVKEFSDHDQLVQYIVDTIDMYVDDARRQRDADKRQSHILRKICQLCCCMLGKFLGNYFITLYLFIKIVYIFNVVLQILLLNLFLDTNFMKFGFESFLMFRYGLNQAESRYFPRETLCDFYVREPLRGGEPLQRITVQCVLTVNLFNQQIFSLLWIWYMIVFGLNIYSLCLWIHRLIPFYTRYEYIKNRITRTSRTDIPRLRIHFKHVNFELGGYVQHELIKSFIIDYLEPDGFFFIRLLTANASDFVVQEIIEGLWTYYVKKYAENDAKKAEDSFYEFRGHWNRDTKSQVSTNFVMRDGLPEDLTDAKRKFLRQTTDFDSRSTNLQTAFKPLSEDV